MSEKKPQKLVVELDPSMEYARRLHYNEKHSGWAIFRAIYWSIYIFVFGVLLYTLVPAGMPVSAFFGLAIMVLAIFVIVYGFSTSLHMKLMKRYA
ncbi:MAG: hypothetical protein M1544_03135 [Candidatus Marsarchaeota archaeon]|nr:hypothetical protein [Candidatus Marsarchaeota archaeon]